MGEIKWSQWGQAGMVRNGLMKIKDIETVLRRFARNAMYILRTTKADHVVYGAKYYNGAGELQEVRFYAKPMDDETFQRDVATMKNVVVYAVHKMA